METNLSLLCQREATYWQPGQKKKDYLSSLKAQEKLYKELRQVVHDSCKGKARDGGDCQCKNHGGEQ